MEQFDSSRPDFSPYGLTVERWIAAPMPRPDRHNEIEINMLGQGRLVYLRGGQKTIVEAGRLTAFWAAVPHQIIGMDEGTNYYVATIPLAWFLQWNLPRSLVDPILHGKIVAASEPGAAGRDIEAFERWRCDLIQLSQEKERIVLLEMQARLLRFALVLEPPLQAIDGLNSDIATLSKAEEIACFIALNYLHPISIKDIGEAVGLHPNYAMVLFKKTFSIAITSFLTEHRLSHAHRLLATTDQTILSIALDSGFGSLSRFNEVFRDRCGCTPRDYRNQNRVGLGRSEINVPAVRI